jgi:RNA polymerase sigma-70 factor (ECF subfamily)
VHRAGGYENLPARVTAMEETDESLMRRVGDGDHEACRALVERYLGRIVAFAARTLGNPADAEDVAQETFVRLWSSPRRWRPGPARLTTWLHRVALNLCLDRLARGREASLETVPEPVDPSPSVVVLLERHAVGQRVNQELAALPPQQRIAITLVHYQGLRNIEAAEVLGVSVEALESLLARGRRTLRARLHGDEP